MRLLAAWFLLMAQTSFLHAAPLSTVTSPQCVVAAPYQDVGAADYAPPTGQDAAGPPADLDAPFVIEVGQVLLPIKVDLAERHGAASAPGLIEEAYVGFVSVRDGVVYFNDRPLDAAYSQILHCR